ncbi:MAG TPA: FIST N-terminal domain-containing protein [Candidatus Sulfotelmatobacter sp.]|jgi:small ligand-binding sensory domain FIST|nr:FIST N-terminal domain-containing protein [Candidatus Sulfotelmatobacter sp.]
MRRNPSVSANPFKAAQASAEHWGLAAKALIDGLSPFPEGANLGFVYVSQDFADELSSIVTLLKETTPVSQWFGAAGYGVLGPQGTQRQGSAIVALVGRIEVGGVLPLEGFDPETADEFRRTHAAWLTGQNAVAGLVHGNPRDPDLVDMISGLSDIADAYLMGGLTLSCDNPVQVAHRLTSSGLSGLLLGDSVPLAVGITQGCHPIGPPHLVTEAVDNVVMGLDGRPALEVLKTEAGEVIARNLSRAAGYIHVALPIEGSDNVHDYAVRNLMGIDPKRGWIAVGDRMLSGERMMFVRRDPNAAQRDMARMLNGLKQRLNGQNPKGGLYFCCQQRGAAMFGTDGRELELIHEVLGDFPLVGFNASGEICHDRLYGYTGVLALFI